MVQLAEVMMMLILQCIIGLQIRIIDFKNAFYWGDIPGGEPVVIVIPRYLESDRGKFGAVLMLNKSIYVQAKSTRLWYEKLQNGLLYSGFLVSCVDPCLLMSKTVISIVYVDDFVFWTRSQSDIGKFMNYFKESGTSYNWRS